MLIMKKSEKVIITLYKLVYAVTLIAVIGLYVSDLISPTATFSRISGNDWLVLSLMSCVMTYICCEEKNKKSSSGAC